MLSTQHAPDIELTALREAVIEEIIKPVLPKELIKGDIKFLVNPTGRFVIGGPQGDCGLTGRKIIVDTYGGAARTAAARSRARIRRRSTARPPMRPAMSRRTSSPRASPRAPIQVSYAIGVAQPTSVMVNTFGTGSVSDSTITALVREHFDLRPKGIIQMLDLLRPIYEKTAAYGHFGREEPEFTWEATDKALALAEAAGTEPVAESGLGSGSGPGSDRLRRALNARRLSEKETPAQGRGFFLAPLLRRLRAAITPLRALSVLTHLGWIGEIGQGFIGRPLRFAARFSFRAGRRRSGLRRSLHAIGIACLAGEYAVRAAIRSR